MNDDAFGVAFVVIAEHPLIGVGVVGIEVGEGEAVESAFRLRGTRTEEQQYKSEIINKKNGFVRIEFLETMTLLLLSHSFLQLIERSHPAITINEISQRLALSAQGTDCGSDRSSPAAPPGTSA